MGLPPMSASGLPCRRLEAKRAGITTRKAPGRLMIGRGKRSRAYKGIILADWIGEGHNSRGDRQARGARLAYNYAFFRSRRPRPAGPPNLVPVSYTHLTLPTI